MKTPMNYRIFLTTLLILIAVIIPTPQNQVMAALGIRIKQPTSVTQQQPKPVTKSTPTSVTQTSSKSTNKIKSIKVKPITASTTNSGAYFVPMTSFPAFKANIQDGLGSFINTLYTYFISIAAVLAVLEITWGGFLWMGSGASITSKESGKKKIEMALMGLLLVLSPVIIFGIINPSVLNLSLGSAKIKITQQIPKTDLSQIAPPTGCILAPGGGPYFEKIVCAKRSEASKNASLCKYGLKIQIPDCTKTYATTGACVDTKKPFIAYCTGKKAFFDVYRYEQSGFLSDTFGKTRLIPISSTAGKAFIASCKSNGGRFLGRLKGPTKTSTSFNRCSGSGVIIDSSIGKEVACWRSLFSCVAPLQK